MIRKDKICEKLIWLLTLIFVVSLYLFITESWGKYLYFGTAACIFVLTGVYFKGKIKLAVGGFHVTLLLFALYSLISLLWAWDPAEAVSKFQTLMSMLLCYSLIYPYYHSRKSVDELLDIVMWAGFIIALYSIYYYGYDAIKMASSAANKRLDNSYNNVNSISMLCAFACVIQFYKLSFQKLSIASLLLIPCIMVITAMQSRKALIVLLVGILLVILVRNLQNKGFFQKMIRIVLVITVFCAAVFCLAQLPFFDGVNQRFVRMLAVFTGQGKVDRSSMLRMRMRQIGMEQFLKTPLFGIGIGSSHVLVSRTLGENTYLHNNYVELLACGGIIGTAIYYIPYVMTGGSFLKKENFCKEGTAICAILLLQLMIWDYGAVSYSTKIHYFYMMIFFLQADFLKEEKKAPQRLTLAEDGEEEEHEL